MRFGYNTNGFAHHRLEDALTILAELGYRSVALTLDHHALNPYDPDTSRQLPLIRERLRSLGLGVVIETGARFLLDPWRKHQPTLLSSDAEERAAPPRFLASRRGRGRRPRRRGSQLLVGNGDGSGERGDVDGSAGRGLPAAVRLRRTATRPAGLRAGAGHVHRHHETLGGIASASRASAFRSDTRHWPSALSGRDADRRGTCVVGATGCGTSTSRTCAAAFTIT